MKYVAVALVALGGTSRADKIEDPPASPPDPTAERAASEANLVSNVRHDKMMISTAVGGGLILGDGVGRGAAGSVRLGFRHRDLVETLEVNVGELLHEPTPTAALPKPSILHNDDVSVMGGLQYYTTPSLWVRGAAGFTEYSVEDLDTALMTIKQTHLGGGGLIGLGVDLVRVHHFVLDMETFVVLSIVGTKGVMATSGLCVGFSFY